LPHSALVRFFEYSHKDDEYFLITLQHGRANLALDRTRDSNAILDKLTHAERGGYTAFYDGIYLATEKVQHGATPNARCWRSAMAWTTIHVIP